jgi:TatD DNase family protein
VTPSSEGFTTAKAHDDDLEDVLQRAVEVGCKVMVTGSDLEESRKAVQLAKITVGAIRSSSWSSYASGKLIFPNRIASLCYATVGVHPCSAKTFETHPGGCSALLHDLETLAVESKNAGLAVAFGE